MYFLRKLWLIGMYKYVVGWSYGSINSPQESLSFYGDVWVYFVFLVVIGNQCILASKNLIPICCNRRSSYLFPSRPNPINWAFVFSDLGLCNSSSWVRILPSWNAIVSLTTVVSFILLYHSPINLIHPHSVVSRYCGFLLLLWIDIWSVHWSPSRSHHESSETIIMLWLKSNNWI